MVKHVNLRPTNPEDSLRRLLHRVDNTSTVPHGVKVATASEASVYTTSAGDQLRWDGDTLAAYDARISEAKAAADEAAADLEQAQAELEAASGRIDGATADLSAQEARVAAAEKALAQAQADLSEVVEIAAAQGRRVDAVEAASAASVEKATAAQKAAADAADELARIQEQIADAAQGGSATNEQLQQAIQAAKAAAESAAKRAQEALRAAGLAQDTADGKATVIYGASAPAGLGVNVGDTHYQVNSQGTVLAWWRWDGKAWVKQSLDGAVISSLDAGKITAGTLDANRIAAGSITADKVLVGVGDEIIANGDARFEGFWGGRWVRMAETPTSWGLTSTDGDYVSEYSPKFPVPLGGGQYRFRVKVRAEHADSKIYVRRNSYDSSGNGTSVYLVTADSGAPATDQWTEFTADDTLPADSVKIGFTVWANHPVGVQAADTTRYTGFSYRRMVQGELIVNGAVTADKVTVDGTLAARVVDAMDANVKRLVVTEDAVIQHATLLGSTVAEQLNVTKRLVARDAVVDGTLDVAQLNVTESMSAEIVRAMTTESKRLIVTEDAILQRATVIENLVTPQLIAQRVDVQDLGAKLITSGSIQTDTSATKGVKINSDGINAWDESGVQTIRINGNDNLLVGTFSTAPQWDTGAKLVQKGTTAAVDLYSKINVNDSYVPHGSVWFNRPEDNVWNTNMTIGATLYEDIRPIDPRIRLYPLQKSINFESKFTHGSAMAFGWGGATNLKAGGFTDITFKFKTPLTETNARIGVFITPEGKNPREMAWTTTNVTTTGFDLRLVNLTSLDSGPVKVHYMAIAYDAT